MLGITSSNFSGVTRAFINPANTITSQRYFDVVVAGGNIFVNNNYLYIPEEDYNLRGFLRKEFPEYDEAPGTYFFDYYTEGNKYGFVNLRLSGPSVMLNFEGHSLSIHNSFRSVLSADRIPHDMAKNALEGFRYSPLQNKRHTHSKPFNIGSMSWAEFGVNYSRYLFDRWDENLSAGITIKYLLGYHGLFFKNNELDYEVTDERDLKIYHYNAEAGFSLPVCYNDNSFSGLESPVRGMGASMDLGITYTRTIEPKPKNSLDWIYTIPDYSPYAYRIGFSLLDLGYIRFNQNVRHLVFDDISTTWENLGSVRFDNTDAFIAEMTEELTEEGEELLHDTEFTVFLPSVASVQFDYKIKNNFFLKGIWMQDLPVIKPRIYRPSYIGIVPRYETMFFEASLPVIMYRYREPKLGLSLRVLYLTVGTENLGGLLGMNDFFGLDFYFSLQFNLDKSRLEETPCMIKQCFDHWR